jgi:hypothetical protein
MSWIAVAIGGGALLTYMGSQSASSAQQNAANNANNTQIGQYNQTRQDQLPWMNRGNAAGNQMAYLLGLPGYGPQSGQSTNTGASSQGPQVMNPYSNTTGDPGVAAQHFQGINGPDYNPTAGQQYGQVAAQGGTPGSSGAVNPVNSSMGGYGSLSTPFGQTNWQMDPGYQWQLQQGQEALDRSAAAKGMTLSGAQQKAISGYNQGMASTGYQQAYNNYNNDQTTLYNRLAGVAGTGQTATNMTGQLGAGMANQVSSNQLGAGNAQAAGYIGGANAINNGVNTGINYWQNQNMMNNLFGSNNGGYTSGGNMYGQMGNSSYTPYPTTGTINWGGG